MNRGLGEEWVEEKMIQNVSNCSSWVTGVYYILFCFLCICLKLSIIKSFFLKESVPDNCRWFLLPRIWPVCCTLGKRQALWVQGWSQPPWPWSLLRLLIFCCVWWPWILNFGFLALAPATSPVLLFPVLMLSLWSRNRPSPCVGLWPSHSTHV